MNAKVKRFGNWTVERLEDGRAFVSGKWRSEFVHFEKGKWLWADSELNIPKSIQAYLALLANQTN